MKEMSTIVKTIANFSFPFVMIYGLYVIAHGHLTPGGGFQGGAVVASGLALMLVAYNSEWISSKIKEHDLSLFESIGALSFITLAFLGIVFSGVFFGNFLVGTEGLFGGIPLNGAADINSGGILPLMNFTAASMNLSLDLRPLSAVAFLGSPVVKTPLLVISRVLAFFPASFGRHMLALCTSRRFGSASIWSRAFCAIGGIVSTGFSAWDMSTRLGAR